MNERRRWFLLCAAAALVAGISYCLVLSGAMLRGVPQPIYSMVVLTCMPGILAGSLTIGTVHSGFGDNAMAIAATAIISGLFWGSILFAASVAARRLRHRSNSNV
jgi:hypothetical protein